MEEKPIPDVYQLIVVQGVIPSWAIPCIEKMCNVKVVMHETEQESTNSSRNTAD